MKNLKLVMILFVFVAFASSQSVLAQNKTKDVKVENNASKFDDKISYLQKSMETATPEEKIKIEEKINAYKNASTNNGNVFVNKNGDTQEMHSLMVSQQNVKQAYERTNITEEKLSLSAKRIDDAKSKLNAAKNEGSLSVHEIELRETKILTAEKELKEANVALEKTRSLIMKKYNENSEAGKKK